MPLYSIAEADIEKYYFRIVPDMLAKGQVGVGGYMREIGAMWQIGFLQGNRALWMGSKMGHFGTMKIMIF